MKMNMKLAGSGKYAIVALLALGSGANVFGDLPGMPAPQPAHENSGAAATPPAPTAEAAQNPPPAAAPAQNMPVRGSLFRQGAVAAAAQAAGDASGQAARAPAVSFTAVQAPQPRKYKKNDIITVIIREDSDSTTNGKGKSNKTQDFDFGIEQMIQLALAQSGLPTVETVNTPSKLPEIKFKYQNNRQSDADHERQDSFSARISATIVDVKPNGTMVVEAVKQIVVDKEEQLFKLSGTCRVEDVSLDNTVLSTQLADLSLSKQTKGTVHDGTKRGWLNGVIDKFTPF